MEVGKVALPTTGTGKVVKAATELPKPATADLTMAKDRHGAAPLDLAAAVGAIDLEGVVVEPKFDVGKAAEGIIQKAGGKLDEAYYRSINLRNMPKTDPKYQEALAAFSKDAGLKQNITPDQLRDVEHFLFAAAWTAGEPLKADASYAERVVDTLRREGVFASNFVATLGYSAAKLLNEGSKATIGKSFLNSRTKPSLDEVIAGIRGAARGFTN
jgi:hypothetical protein